MKSKAERVDCLVTNLTIQTLNVCFQRPRSVPTRRSTQSAVTAAATCVEGRATSRSVRASCASTAASVLKVLARLQPGPGIIGHSEENEVAEGSHISKPYISLLLNSRALYTVLNIYPKS